MLRTRYCPDRELVERPLTPTGERRRASESENVVLGSESDQEAREPEGQLNSKLDWSGVRRASAVRS